MTELRNVPTIWGHTVLPATRHKWTRPAITPARRRVVDFLEGWKVELTYRLRGQESNSRPLDHKSDAKTEPPKDALNIA